ncbi:hypothetical protein K2X05_10415 [bacterium]|nr:hypothetical protein [bacterium]
MKMILFAILVTSTFIVNASYGNGAAKVDEDAPLKVTKLSDGREILTKDGMTVYIFDNDQGSVSSCYDACAKAWPPVLAVAGEVLGESMGVTTRKDGSQQLTYDGLPIYFFAGDGAEGDINGDGLGGVWHIILE